MKNLVYLSSSGLGENLMATPAMEFLSRTYKILLIVKESFVPAFQGYDFIHEVEGVKRWDPGNPNFRLEGKLLQKILSDYSPGFFMSHSNHCENFFAATPEFSGAFSSLPKVPVPRYSSARCNLLKIGFPEAEIHEFDLKLRQPIPFRRDGTRRIILYQGSHEHLRRLPDTEMNQLQTHLKEYIYQGYEVHCIFNSQHGKGIDRHPSFKYLETSASAESLHQVLKLFASGVNVMIGPDSGLTNLGHCFRIPMVWFETRDRVEMIIDPVHYKEIYHFRKRLPSCSRECRGAKHTEQIGLAPGLMTYPMKNVVENVQQLPCFQNKSQPAPCLTFDRQDYSQILRLIDRALSTQDSR